MRGANAWLDCPGDKADADLTLICFGPAGSGASQFRAWNRLAPAWLRIVGVQLPGREQRYREAPYTDAMALAHELAAAVTEARFGQFAFFGHSFGALLAFESARRLRDAGARQPGWLGVAGRPAPHVPHAYRKTYALPQDEFVDVLRSYGGTDARILEKPDLMGFFLPAIRADLEANTEYVYQAGAPLAMPLMAIRGRQDMVCSAAELSAWSELTSAGCTLLEADGGHFFFNQNIGEFLGTVIGTLHAMRGTPHFPHSVSTL